MTVVSSLPEGQREVLLMRFVDGMQLDEIAVALAIPLGTVKSRLHNAIQTLRADPRVNAIAKTAIIKLVLFIILVFNVFKLITISKRP